MSKNQKSPFSEAFFVPKGGVEPPHLKEAADFESAASTSSATSATFKTFYNKAFFSAITLSSFFAGISDCDISVCILVAYKRLHHSDSDPYFLSCSNIPI